MRLFTGRGYDAVTVADVAEAAGVSAMTVYRHFPTKEDLVLVPNQPARLIAEQVAASSLRTRWCAGSVARWSRRPRC